MLWKSKMDNLSLQTIEDYLMNNDASINIESFLDADGIEYTGRIASDALTCVVHSDVSFEDALRLLSIELAKYTVIANSTGYGCF
jgi:hypothetical protein